MKNFSRFLLPLLLCLVSCGKGVRVEVTLDAPAASQLTLRQLDMNVYRILDTLTTDRRGRVVFRPEVVKGQPEFFYLFYGGRRIASLLLEAGDRVRLDADTLGAYSVAGSPQSDTLRVSEKAYADFITAFAAAKDSREMGALYVQHYRECVRRIVANSHSLVVIPILYERLSEGTPVFHRSNDAVLFQAAADSLTAVYPESRYVKALQKEAEKRTQLLEMSLRMDSAPRVDYPDLELPDIRGNKCRISDLKAKAVLLHFWTSEDPAQRMFNLDTLLPLYEEFHDRGLEIYSVCVDTDKVRWGSVVSAQKLPWVNVNDGRGAASNAVVRYNVQSLPETFLLCGGEALQKNIGGAAALRRSLSAVLY